MTSLVSRKSFPVLLVLSHLAVLCAGWAQPDLAPTGLTAPSPVVTQHQMDVAWAVENQGTERPSPHGTTECTFRRTRLWVLATAT